MKKVLSIALALVMMLAVCVPAFAANPITNTTEDNGQTVVKTSTQKENGEDAEHFSVTIPADTTIPWETEVTNLVYTVDSQLAYGKHLEVSVAGNNVMKLAEDEAETLAYTLGGTTAYVAAGPVVKAADQDLTVTIAADAWANAIVGEYADTLTFTVEAVTPVAP